MRERRDTIEHPFIAGALRQIVTSHFVVSQQPHGFIARGKDCIEHRLIRIEFGILRQVSNDTVTRDDDSATLRSFTSGDYSQQRSLAGTVESDEPDFVAIVEAKRY